MLGSGKSPACTGAQFAAPAAGAVAISNDDTAATTAISAASSEKPARVATRAVWPAVARHERCLRVLRGVGVTILLDRSASSGCQCRPVIVSSAVGTDGSTLVFALPCHGSFMW